jgi:putative SOS response-associated peptidase YedK
MCGRFTLIEPKEIEKRFETQNQVPLLEPIYNVAPSFTLPIIARNSPNRAIMAKWGFIPVWEQKKPRPFGLINIRSESCQEKPYFKNVLLSSRCLIPATGFYEWKELKLESKPEKVPFYITLKDQELFSLAGVYSMYEDTEGKPQYYFAILTSEPNSFMKDIHRRMPVILEKSEENKYLDPDNRDFDTLYKLITTQYPSDKMKAYPVSRAVNSPRNNSQELLKERMIPKEKTI